MRLHIFDNIADDSKEVSDFRSLLKYSLHFDYQVPDLAYECSDDASAKTLIDTNIETIFKSCDSICHYLFHLKGAYKFFGSPDSSIPETLYSDLCFSEEFWLSSIKYHCVISSLHTLLYFLLKDYSMTTYGLLVHAQDLGYFSMIKKKILIKENDSLKFNNYIKENDDSAFSLKFTKDDLSNFLRTYNTFYNKLSSYEQAVLGYDQANHTFSYFNSDLNYWLLEKRKSLSYHQNPKIVSPGKSIIASYGEFLSHTKYLRNRLDSIYKFSDSDIVDSILFKYKTERYYNFSFTLCIVNMLLKFSNKNENFSIDSIPWEFLSTCFYLPNVFSREAFFKFALHSFNNERLEDSIFFKRHQDTGPTIFVDDPTADGTRLLTWLDLFRKYNIFFSHIIFPIYEKCFFLLFKDSLFMNKNFDSCNSFLFKAIDILHTYILTHSDAIMGNKARDRGLPKLLQTDGFQNDEILKLDIADQKAAALLTQKMLLKQNNIIHPAPSHLRNSDHLGFSPGNTYHRQLMNLTIDSIMNNIQHIF